MVYQILFGIPIKSDALIELILSRKAITESDYLCSILRNQSNNPLLEYIPFRYCCASITPSIQVSSSRSMLRPHFTFGSASIMRYG